MAKQVIHIPATKSHAGNNLVRSRVLRVAAYCRVSSEQDEQLNSFENQVSYYTEYINNNPQYEMAGIYADEGISGTNTKRRENFNRMIADCEAGKIDLVITKSISRFARNTQDCLNYSRKLKDLGIGIKFEKENINTMDSTGELLFTILSSLAQDESRSISENCKWGIQTHFKRGRLLMNTNRFYGYDSDEEGNLIINTEQAKVVKWIFHSFMEGMNPDTIAKKLNEDGVEQCMGGHDWKVSQVMAILQNEKHMGDVILQKTFTPDFLTHKCVKNEGQMPQYHVPENHEPIVSKELWEAVQLEIARRKDYREKFGFKTLGQFTDEIPFTHRVICGECGKNFVRRTHTRSWGTVKVWQCTKRYKQKGVKGCDSKNLNEKDLMVGFVKAFNTILRDKKNYTLYWKELIKNGNALEVYRGKQFLELTKGKRSITEADNALVNMIFEYCVFYSNGSIEYHFLDGTTIKVNID